MLAIVDYNAGNTYNVQKAFAYLGVDTVLTADRDTILNATGIILPGVGAFKTAMNALHERDLVSTLQQAAQSRSSAYRHLLRHAAPFRFVRRIRLLRRPRPHPGQGYGITAHTGPHDTAHGLERKFLCEINPRDGLAA